VLSTIVLVAFGVSCRPKGAEPNAEAIHIAVVPKGSERTISDAPLARETNPPSNVDGDEFADWEDFCPNEPEDVDDCNDEDGCPDPDNDGDGIPDERDRCPLEYHRFGGVDGCPGQAPPNTVIFVENDDCFAVMKPILFGPNDSALDRDATEMLDELAAYLARCSDALIIEAVGRTSSDEVAPGLAEARARQVRARVVAHGIDGRRMRARGESAAEHRRQAIEKPYRTSKRVDFYVVRFLSCAVH